MRCNQALTLIEILVVAVIISIVSAIMYPVILHTKQKGEQTRCVGHMRQIFLAIDLYRTDLDSQAIIGDMNVMGLPAMPLVETLNLNPALGYCRGPASLVVPTGFGFYYMPAPPNTIAGKRWTKYVNAEEENTPLLIDLNHNPVGTPVYDADYKTKLGLAVRLTGQLVVRRKKGNPLDDFTYWK